MQCDVASVDSSTFKACLYKRDVPARTGSPTVLVVSRFKIKPVGLNLFVRSWGVVKIDATFT